MTETTSVQLLEKFHPTDVTTFNMNISSDSQLLLLKNEWLVAAEDHSVTGCKHLLLCNTNTGFCIPLLTDHTGYVRGIIKLNNNITSADSDDVQCISYDLATCSTDHTIQCWRLNIDTTTVPVSASLTWLRTVYDNYTFFSFVQLQLNGCDCIATGGEEYIDIWDRTITTRRKRLQDRRHNVFKIIELLQGPLLAGECGGNLASYSSTGVIKIWNWTLKTKKPCIATLKQNSQVHDIVQLQSVDYLAATYKDATLRIWELNTGTCTQVLTGYTHCASTIIQLRWGELVSVSPVDCTLKVWDVVSGKCLQTIYTSELVVNMIELHNGNIFVVAKCGTVKVFKYQSFNMLVW